MSQEFRLENINETKNYFLEEIAENELTSRKHRKVRATLNYIERILILVSTNTGSILISACASLFGIPIGTTSSVTGLKIRTMAAGIEKYKPIIKKKKNMHNKTLLLAKFKLNSIEVLVSKALIESVISHDEFSLINDVLKEYDKMKEEIKNQKRFEESKYPKVVKTKNGRISYY